MAEVGTPRCRANGDEQEWDTGDEQEYRDGRGEILGAAGEAQVGSLFASSEAADQACRGVTGDGEVADADDSRGTSAGRCRSRRP